MVPVYMQNQEISIRVDKHLAVRGKNISLQSNMGKAITKPMKHKQNVWEKRIHTEPLD